MHLQFIGVHFAIKKKKNKTKNFIGAHYTPILHT